MIIILERKDVSRRCEHIADEALERDDFLLDVHHINRASLIVYANGDTFKVLKYKGEREKELAIQLKNLLNQNKQNDEKLHCRKAND